MALHFVVKMGPPEKMAILGCQTPKIPPRASRTPGDAWGGQNGFNALSLVQSIYNRKVLSVCHEKVTKFFVWRCKNYFGKWENYLRFKLFPKKIVGIFFNVFLYFFTIFWLKFFGFELFF